MQYFLVETFNDVLTISTDENGNTIIYDGLKAAKEACEELQDGLIVPLTPTIPLIEKVHAIVGMARFELGEDWDEDNIEEELDNFLT